MRLGALQTKRLEAPSTQVLRRALVGVFIGSRLIAYIQGVRFDARRLGSFWQFIDPALLRHDLFRSLWYLHAQPPLFNLYLGVVLHLPHGTERGAFAVTFLILGLAIALGMFNLMIALKVPRLAAFGVAALFIVSPAALLYENFLFYTYVDAAALICGCYFFYRFLDTGRMLYGGFAFALFAAVVLVRSSFHLVWLLAIILVAFVSARCGWRRVAVAACLPVLVATGWYVKNLAVFGTFTSSSWLGESLAHIVFFDADHADIARLVRNGKLTTDVLLTPFSYPAEYRNVPTPHTGVPVLDTSSKSTRYPNFNNKGYIVVSNRLLKESIRYIRLRPGHYLGLVGGGLRLASLPASEYPFLAGNAHRIAWWQKWGSRVLGGQLSLYNGYILVRWPKQLAVRPAQVGWAIVFGYAVAIGATPLAIWSLARRRPNPVAGTAVVLGVTVVYALVVTTLLEYGENNRFRFETDPLTWVFVAAALAALVRRLRERQPLEQSRVSTRE